MVYQHTFECNFFWNKVAFLLHICAKRYFSTPKKKNVANQGLLSNSEIHTKIRQKNAANLLLNLHRLRKRNATPFYAELCR